jgi:hypothetical protein
MQPSQRVKEPLMVTDSVGSHHSCSAGNMNCSSGSWNQQLDGQA